MGAGFFAEVKASVEGGPFSENAYLDGLLVSFYARAEHSPFAKGLSLPPAKCILLRSVFSGAALDEV
jgi:hypothetical protein